jgi:hypothetical protein
MVCLGVKDRNARSAGCITQLDRVGLKIGGGEEVNEKPDIIEVAPPPVSKELKKRWSYFIRKVYETDPLVCPKCQQILWSAPSVAGRCGYRLYWPARSHYSHQDAVK